MKKDVFADWLKELCMLVFIQTIQAFIFAIVMSLILSLLSKDYGESDNISGAVGIIAVMLLAAVSKVEELVKKIFGIKSNVHDTGMRGGMKSLATTMLAANLAKGVLDNGRKAIGGIGGAVAAPIKAQKEMNMARARMARDLNTANKAPQIGAGGGAGAGAGAGGGGGTPQTANDYYNRAIEAKKKGDMNGYRYNMGIAAGMNKAANAAPAAQASNPQQNLQEKIDAYNDRISEIKANRNKAVRSSLIKAASGITETAGAIGFGAVGMAAGAALGEGKEIIQGGLAGAGLGDKAGSIAMKPVSAANDISQMISENRKVNDELMKQTDVINEQGSRVRKVREAKKKLNEQLSNFDVGDL